jgi:uncharacterized protein
MDQKDYKDWFDKKHDPTLVDGKARELTQIAYQKTNCLSCAKCCLTTVTVFDREDIANAAKQIAISQKQFIKDYLIRDVDDSYTTISVPCPMLDLETHYCKIYEARPKACRSFPHTDRKHFLRRKKAHLANASFCLITQDVMDGLITADLDL